MAANALTPPAAVVPTFLERSIGLLNGVKDDSVVNSPINISINLGPPFTCLLCQSWFYVGAKLRLHYVVNHDFLNCVICDLTLQNDVEKTEHDVRMHGAIPCEICRRDAGDFGEIMRHYEAVHDAKPCRYCGVLISPPSFYNDHLIKSHQTGVDFLEGDVVLIRRAKSNSKVLFFCNMCKSPHRNKEKDNFFGHFTSYHKIRLSFLIDMYKTQRFAISIDGIKISEFQKSPESADSAATSSDSEPSPKPSVKTVCHSCNDDYTKVATKTCHSVYCLNKKPCPVCCKIFPNAAKLNYHVQKYHAEFGCAACGDSTFPAKKDLEEHLRHAHDLAECRFCEELIGLDDLDEHLLEKHRCGGDPGAPKLLRNDLDERTVLCALCRFDLTQQVESARNVVLHFYKKHRVGVKQIIKLIGGKVAPKALPESVAKDEEEEGSRSDSNVDVTDLRQNHLNDALFKKEVDFEHINLVYEFETASRTKLHTNCDFCHIDELNFNEYLFHVTKTHKIGAIERVLHCPKCLTVQRNVFQLLEHLQCDHDGEFFACPVCDKSVGFADARHHILNQHLSDVEKFDLTSFGVPCQFCDAKFWMLGDLNDHEVRLHLAGNAELFWQCYVCSRDFSVHRILIDHVKEEHADRSQYEEDVSYKCISCKTAFPDVCSLREHFTTAHLALFGYVCPESTCGAFFKMKKNAKQHYKRVHSTESNVRKREHTCEICGKFYKNYTAYSIHKKMKHGKDKGFKCRLCKVALVSSEQRKLHYTTSHPGELAYKCTVCGKGFFSKSGLYGHKKLHAATTVVECPHCQKEFTRRDSYNEHLMIHIGPKHKCPHCPKTFTQKSNLTRHVRIHTGAKPYACNFCPKRFSDKGACNSHRRVHSKEERSDCPVCGKSFTQAQKMRYHLRIHTGEGLVHCDVCDKICTNIHSLKEHRTIHDRQTQWICECGKAFSKDRYLQRHVQKIHVVDVNKFRCQLCSLQLHTKADLKLHVQTHAEMSIGVAGRIDDVRIKTEPASDDEKVAKVQEGEVKAKRRRKPKAPVRFVLAVDNSGKTD